MSGTLIGMTLGMLGILAALITPGLFSAPSAENRACKKVIKDIESDFIYYSKYLVTAAEPGFAEAQWMLGLVYGLGKGVGRDLYQAFYWFEQSAALGYLTALEEVTLMLNMQNDFHNAALAGHYYDFAIEMGSTRKDLAAALIVPDPPEVGNAYERGRGVEKDEARALYWYEKAVAQGHPIAMFNLGWMYAMGNGVPQDIDRGVKLFRELLDRGDFRGKFSIGRFLVEGIGMDVDKEAGFKLIRKAAPKYERARKYFEQHNPDSPENS